MLTIVQTKCNSFKVAARGENLQRAQAQFRLLQALEAQESALKDCAAANLPTLR